ncbi:MAG: tRNA (cytidine(34)-2'-O)-methyltransferase [Lentisphaeria bacterium]|nr:tRNA (cytidine(34)-2'-O)-methyltransferase [Lentisphaeria bacterium]MBR7128326.1 tRNA (cytidine(34)-2'-O)-methyltransferase [Lentisphaeria bacterium]
MIDQNGVRKLFNIVLFEPEIPQNTGSIGRMCVSTDTRLHLIKPLGFELTDKYLKRAGMDYWQYIDLHIYENWEDFLAKNPQDIKLYFFTTKTEKSFWECPYEEDAYLVFGSESKGLNDYLYKKYQNNQYTIPMTGQFHRSLNLACSAGIVLYEGLRRFAK